MITESQQRTIRRECDIVISMCKAALEHVVTLDAKCLTEDGVSVSRMASHIRTGMFEASILRDINDYRKVAECQHDK
jgi:hypothetical protein